MVVVFRCNIPVIVMGETGCGKTRLIKFMCDLWKPPGAEVTNMILMKLRGRNSYLFEIHPVLIMFCIFYFFLSFEFNLENIFLRQHVSVLCVVYKLTRSLCQPSASITWPSTKLFAFF